MGNWCYSIRGGWIWISGLALLAIVLVLVLCAWFSLFSGCRNAKCSLVFEKVLFKLLLCVISVLGFPVETWRLCCMSKWCFSISGVWIWNSGLVILKIGLNLCCVIDSAFLVGVETPIALLSLRYSFCFSVQLVFLGFPVESWRLCCVSRVSSVVSSVVQGNSVLLLWAVLEVLLWWMFSFFSLISGLMNGILSFRLGFA